MLFPFVSLIIISIVLYILSFFVQDRFGELEKQIEQLSISNFQESYKLKKRIKVLEEELLMEAMPEKFTQKETMSQPPLLKEVQRLSAQGLTVKEIAQKTALQEHDVKAIIYQIGEK
ncbi:hypothetical protein [Salirhabdus salicampi]|uniref:hypothetical protein n=1 Tax=Salirhabdus salicampi TaxID=476102 RepID=UPI0020C28A5C|nr:hypothetical protein [Salirhabdus salicampi]MCP8616866.1 hypothetical protein [Salirhabdus salicampi]